MRTTVLAHLVRADVRHFRLILASLVAIAIVSTALDIVRPITAGSPRLLMTLGTAATLIWLAELLVGIAAIAMIVQAHPLVGSNAFWMTRPIQPRVLMLSKLALLGLIAIVLPLICDVAFMVLYAVPPGWMAAVTAQSVLLGVLWLAAFMSIATVTRGLGGFAFACGLLLVAAALSLAISATIAAAQFSDEFAGGMAAVSVGFESSGPGATSSLVFMLLLIAGAVALMAVQYRSRLRRYSVSVGVIGVAIAFAASWLWPWPILERPPEVPSWARDPASLRLTAHPSSMGFQRQTEWVGSGNLQAGVARIALANVADGWQALVRVTHAAVTLEDGTRLESRGFAPSQMAAVEPSGESQDRWVMRSVLQVSRLSGVGAALSDDAVVLQIRRPEFSAHQGKTGAYAGTFAIELSRHDVVAALPPRPGASYQEGAERFAIDELRQSGGFAIRLRRSGATTMFHPVAGSYSLYLRNRPRGEAIATWATSMRDQALAFGFVRGASHVSVGSAFGFGVDAQLVRPFSNAPYRRDTVEIDVDEQWLRDAELVIVRTTQAGSVTRTLEIPAFELREKALAKQLIPPDRTAFRPASR